MSTTIQSCYERILIAIDGSKPSEWAVRVGKQLAEQLGARVMLVNVAEPAFPVYEDWDASQQINAMRRQRGRELLTQASASVSENIKAETSLRKGFSSDQIIAAAREWKADLIVMGTRGQGRLAQFVIGSTAEAVIRGSPCPVMTVSHEPKAVMTKPEDWVGVGADCLDPICAHTECHTKTIQ